MFAMHGNTTSTAKLVLLRTCVAADICMVQKVQQSQRTEKHVDCCSLVILCLATNKTHWNVEASELLHAFLFQNPTNPVCAFCTCAYKQKDRPLSEDGSKSMRVKTE